MKGSKMNYLKPFTVLILSLVLFLLNNKTFAQSDWEFDAALYGWFAGMEGTVGVANVQEELQVTASDLLQNLKFTAGGHFEARNPQVSLIADVFFVGLGQDGEVQQTVLDSTFTQTGEVNLDEWIV